MDHLLRCYFPQAPRHLLDAAHDEALVLVAFGGHHAENFQHGIGIVRIPPAGSKSHLSEYLPMLEGVASEGVGGRDEIIETAVVPDGNEPVPNILDLRRIALA